MHEAFLFFYTLASYLDVHQPESGLPFDISRFARSYYPIKQVSGTQGKTTSIIWLQISASFPFAIKPIGPHVTEKSMAASWTALLHAVVFVHRRLFCHTVNGMSTSFCIF